MDNPSFLKLKAFEGEYFTHSRSAAGRWLHYKLLNLSPGEINVSVLVRHEMTNPSGLLHGGMIGLICDEICGLCFYTMGKETFYTTVSLNINYLFSANEGEIINVHSKVLRCGKRMANVECYLYNTQGILIAHATTNLMNSGGKIFDLSMPFSDS
jgi:uncharacterized protein (TIGR00369 family)